MNNFDSITIISKDGSIYFNVVSFYSRFKNYYVKTLHENDVFVYDAYYGYECDELDFYVSECVEKGVKVINLAKFASHIQTKIHDCIKRGEKVD